MGPISAQVWPGSILGELGHAYEFNGLKKDSGLGSETFNSLDSGLGSPLRWTLIRSFDFILDYLHGF